MNRLPGVHPDPVARRSRVWRAVVALLGLSLILAGCTTGSDDDVPEDRQFANDPAPTRAATETPAETVTVVEREQPPRDVGATPAELLGTRGAPSTLYTLAGDRPVVLDMDAGIARRDIAVPDGARVLGLAASPTGDRAAIVISTDGIIQVLFVNAEGESIGGPYGATEVASPVASPGALPVSTPGATPDIDRDEGPVPVSWAPQGNGVLLVHRDAVVYVDVERAAEPIPTRGVSGTILAAWASPTGGQILVHAAMDDGTHRAYIVQRDTGESSELLAMRTQPGMGLSELAWLPPGNGVVFVQGELVNGEVMQGQLFRYHFRNESPSLVATSGQGGPSASIRNVAISPDGRSVAYEVSILDINRWSLHSMWVRSLKHEGQALQVPVDSGHMVNSIAWSHAGLTWTYTAQYGTPGSFLGLIPEDGEVVEIIPLDIPGASPQASPVVDGSPVASPMATPIGSPGATPSGPGV